MGEASEIVIPDTCVDIIYRMDDRGNIVTSDFVGVNDRSFRNDSPEKNEYPISVFAIRFYAWGAYVFSEDSFAKTVNGRYDVRERFGWLDKELRKQLSEPGNLTDRIRFVEKLLVKKWETARNHELVDRVVNDILLHQGALEIGQLAKENFISGRQLERLFHEYIGITPKKLSGLVRYQYLWNDVVFQKDFHLADAVCKYGYTDSAHLAREFTRYHSMNIQTARKMAFQLK